MAATVHGRETRSLARVAGLAGASPWRL